MRTYNQALLGISALQVLNGADAIRYPVKKNYGSVETIQKRSSDGQLQFEITNEHSYYSVEVVLGSNNQTASALLDTGSSDLWILGKNSKGVDACDAYLEQEGYDTAKNTSEVYNEIQSIQYLCESMGTFDPSQSETFKIEKNGDPFFIQYDDLSYAQGYWGSDSLNVNGVEVNSLLFAVAEVSNSSNVCGISFKHNEASYYNLSIANNATTDNISVVYVNNDADNAFTYDNLPYTIKNQGLINRVSYSLFLNALGAESGDLLFGAIDESKYTGDLYTIPLVNFYSEVSDKPIDFDVTLQGVGFVAANGTATTINQQYFAAVADSGTSILHVPQDLADLMANQVGATYDNDLETYIVDCPSQDNLDKSAFVLQFGGQNYFFPYTDFILFTSDDSVCYLNIAPTDDQHVILGDNILSSLYVVYDLENYELSFARANYDGADSTDSKKIKTIPSASESIPEATKAPGYSSTWVSAVDTITLGGDIFDHSTKVSNPWASTATKYFGFTYLSTTESSEYGSYQILSGSAKATTTKSNASGSASATSSSTKSSTASSSKAKNGAGIISGSFATLLAALLI